MPKNTSSVASVKVEKDLPKAMIKPNVLTHVIDGFIIQEANEPFPVTRQRYADKDADDEPPKKKSAMDENSHNAINQTNGQTSLPPDMIACEHCGKPEHKAKLKKKRFCSLTCARQSKASMSEQPTEAPTQSNTSNTVASNQNAGADAKATAEISSITSNANNAAAPEKMQTEPIPSAPITAYSNSAAQNGATRLENAAAVAAVVAAEAQQVANVAAANAVAAAAAASAATGSAGGSHAAATPAERPAMADWSVAEVCEFIRHLPGCLDYVDDFEQQEIDGQALMLLKENHLVNAMGMKLGPALKIVAKVESMKEQTPAPSADKEAQQ
ncbi:PREDICTED: polyhomeotic-proximal chromatin protein-like [Rhagoletis zephyria]|uniref:polyhomeotic-proximal chromatin protein-like n=1 Tax=Rhagoletis zephyria TaxID=28612 RepID=UPI00081161C2|nr:PREDICTED: polyhomeotic-proximal chromatin protein-like [Rhagoletis zephyria]